MQTLKRTCRFCLKVFRAPAYYVKRGQYKFCSHACADKQNGINNTGSGSSSYIKKVRIRACKSCGKRFRPRPELTRKGGMFGRFCCKKCSGAWSSKHRCGRRHHFYKRRIQRTCVLCKRRFSVLPRKLKQKTCSRRCNAVIASKKNHYFNSSIERKTRVILNNLNIPHTFQKNIPKVGCVDFFVEPNFIIQCDGDYWHGRPQAKLRDAAQNKTASDLGYTMIRLTETRIKSDAAGVSEQLKLTLARN